jgi:hypothetical protein
MKYKIYHRIDNSYDIITEDGGVAVFYHNQENYVTHYYERSLSECNPADHVWDELSEGKIYINDWEGSDEPAEEEVIKDALEWLVFPAPAEGWELDQSIWSEFFPMTIVGRHVEGISLNGLEYLLNEDGSVMQFASEYHAKKFLRSKIHEDVTDELLNEVFTFETTGVQTPPKPND